VTRRLKVTAQVLALGCVAGLLALLVWQLGHQQHAPRVGAVAPAFTLRRLAGHGKVSLAAYRGQPVVLNFWASWCQPCKGEASVLEHNWTSYRNRGVVFLGVDYHDLASDARRFISAHALTFPMLEDGSGRVTGRYGIRRFPRRTSSAGRAGSSLTSQARSPIPASPGSFAALSRRRSRDSARPRRRRGRACARRPGSGLRTAAHLADVPRGPGDVPDVSHHTRPVRFGRRSPDRGVHLAADRAVRDKQQIESELVANYGPAILAAPPHKGFDLIAWWLPIAGVLAGAIVLALGVWRWSRRSEPEPEEPADSGLDDETERRLDDLLARFD
jgi:cytochrome c biogenesis protein CcmG/thiol:disulfide interchange protein DsbE